MTAVQRILTSTLWLGGTLIGLGEITLNPNYLDLSNSIDRVYFGKDVLSDAEWDAQSFNSSEARQLKAVVLNLYCDPDVTPQGTFWVRLHAPNPVDGAPSTNVIASIAESRPIAELSTNVLHTITFDSLSIPLEAEQTYFIVVGGNAGAVGLLWGFTNDPVGATGFPSLFTYSGDGGATWRTPFMSALPQRMQVVGDPNP